MTNFTVAALHVYFQRSYPKQRTKLLVRGRALFHMGRLVFCSNKFVCSCRLQCVIKGGDLSSGGKLPLFYSGSV